MNHIQQSYLNAQRTVDHLVKEHGAPIRRADCEALDLAKEVRNKARRELILWGLDKCLALCQTDLDREAFQCLRTYAGRGLSTSQAKRLAEMMLKLEDQPHDRTDTHPRRGDCLLVYARGEAMRKYTPPTPATIREWLDKHGLSQTDAAKLAKIDGRTMRRYVAQEGATPIPYAVWFTITTRQRVRLLDAEKRGSMPPIK